MTAPSTTSQDGSTVAPAAANAAAPPDADLVRGTLRQHAAGVTVLTLPGPVGFTATSFTPVSLDPPLVSFCVALTASSRPAVEAATVFGVNLLGSDQEDVALLFARRGVDRFAGVDWHPGPDGIPLIGGVPGWLHCAVARRQSLGDHVLVVGEVLEVGGQGLAQPDGSTALVHHGGRILGVAATEA